MRTLADVIRHPDLPEQFRADLHQLYLGMNAATMPTMAECRAALNRLQSSRAKAEDIQTSTRQFMQQLEQGQSVDPGYVQSYLKKVDSYVSEEALPELRARLS